MFRISTQNVQDLANIVKLEYLPKLAEDMKSDNLWILSERYDELVKVIDHIHSDEFFIEDKTNS